MMGDLRKRVLEAEYEAPRIEDLGQIGEPVETLDLDLPEDLLDRLTASVL